MNTTIQIDRLREILRPYFTAAELQQIIATCMAQAQPGAPRFGLTPTQKKVLDFIRSNIAQHGVAPSYEEMAAAAGKKSKSGIHRIMVALADRGYIKRIPNSARAIMVLE